MKKKRIRNPHRPCPGFDKYTVGRGADIELWNDEALDSEAVKRALKADEIVIIDEHDKVVNLAISGREIRTKARLQTAPNFLRGSGRASVVLPLTTGQRAAKPCLTFQPLHLLIYARSDLRSAAYVFLDILYLSLRNLREPSCARH